MPRGNHNPTLPHSGLVGLNWRRRGRSGYWVVSKAVPLSLRSRLRTPKGKPRVRIELSTGEAELSKAAEHYGPLMAQIDALLAEAARIPPRIDAANGIRASLASAYKCLAQVQSQKFPWAEQAKAAGQHMASKLTNAAEALELLTALKQTAVGLAAQKLEAQGVEPNQANLSQFFLPLPKVLEAAEAFKREEGSVGLLANHSPLGQSLLEIAGQPRELTISEVAQAKCREIRSEGGRSGYDLAIKAWGTLIDSHEIGSLTTENLNRFLQLLVTVGWSGKPVGADTANGMAQRLVALIKWLNQEDGGNRKVPIFKRRKKDQFAQRLQHRDKATRKEEVQRVLDYCLKNGLKDKLLWVLLVDNTTLRVGESLSLRWRDLVQKEGHWFFDLKNAKTPSGIRYVPLNTRLVQYLLPERGLDDEPVISNAWQQLKRPRSGPENWCQKIKKKLALQGTFKPHAFRHGAGGDLGYTQTEHTKKMLMGHKGGITDLYTRADLVRMAEAAEEIGTPWEPTNA